MKCIFCGRSEEQVKELVGNSKTCVCNECIAQLSASLAGPASDQSDDGDDSEDLSSENLPKPQEIHAFLDEYVIGQDEAKKILSVAVYNHYKRILSESVPDDGVELAKSNILLIGPTGCGKTYLAQTLARMLHVPYAITDATTVTEAGYVGDDVENILLRLIEAANYDVKRAEKGIIYIDEIDKIARKSEGSTSITRDVSGEGVQQALLRIMEGTVASVPRHGGRKHPDGETIRLDTTKVLFICGGAFAGLEKIVEHRVGRGGIGFRGGILNSQRYKGEVLRETLPMDVLKFGFIPEFVGRLPIITTVSPLDNKTLVRILVEPKNALVKQYSRILGLDGVGLEVTPDGLEAIADEALQQGTGARGLRAILESRLLDVMYEAPSRQDVERCVIDRDVVVGQSRPMLVAKKRVA